jgi:hypothetical protein
MLVYVALEYDVRVPISVLHTDQLQEVSSLFLDFLLYKEASHIF